jgi:hypothetical protein
VSLAEQALLDGQATARRPWARGVGQILLALLTLAIVWMVFYVVGWTLLQMRPTAPMARLPLGGIVRVT